jgi:hypothetical protein
MAGLVIRTEDGAAKARALLADRGLRPAMGGVMVPPEAAGGAAVVFV